MSAADALVRIAFFLGACLAAGVVTGATRATSCGGILRESARAFLSLAGGIVLLCLAIWLITGVAQS